MTIVTPSADAAARLRTALMDTDTLQNPSEAGLAFARVRSLGARAARLSLSWDTVAHRRPANPTNPSDPAYEWSAFDETMRLARAHGIEPIVLIEGTPRWAGSPNPGSLRPDPIAYGQFARAAATRYSGAVAGLPRVRDWQVWNEPNVNVYFGPQSVGGKLVAPDIYREMVNRFAAAVHAVHPDNNVIAGGMSPFTVRAGSTVATGPLRFMRRMLCMSGGRHPRPTCSARANFDIWSHHPYTSGGPTHHAVRPDDVSLGDLPEMRRLLMAAVKAHRVVTSHRMRFWVTEFSWDSKPPDPTQGATPIRLHARWVSEALYRMWRDDVELVTWYLIRDQPYPAGPIQSGLYFRGRTFLQDRPKPSALAFRFPFVAFRARHSATVWGRTPGEVPATVTVERRVGRTWKRLAVMRTNRFGIFSGRVSLAGGRRVRPPGRPPAASNYRQAVLADAPSSYWRLGEAAGARAAVDQRGAHTGTYVGGPGMRRPGAIVGDPDRAVFLDGKDDSISLDSIQSPETVEAWIKTSANRPSAVFSNRNPFSHFTFLGVEQSGNALAFDSGAVLGSRWIGDGAWHHVVSTYASGVLRLYVDGELDDQATIIRLEGSAPAAIGFDAALRSHFRGTVDEVAIYDHALSAARIKAHYTASGRRPATLEQFQLGGKGPFLRARLANGTAASLPFSLAKIPDRFVRPFGS